MRALVLVLAFASKAQAEKITNEKCNAVVSGSVVRDSSWWSDMMGFETTHCKCPGNTVISGPGQSAICQTKRDNFEQYFDIDGDVQGQNCKCAFKSGCGIHEVTDMDDLLPANAAAKGMPAPMLIGNEQNIDTGVPELDKEFYGLWWMKDNPVDEELASMAGAFSELKGQNKAPGEVQWPLTVGVPNSLARHWAWPNNWIGRKIIMSQYTSAVDKANNFTMRSTTTGSIDTTLTTQWGVWVDEWGLYKIDDDTWNRPTTFQSGSPWPDTNYTLTRIIYGNGTATKYFDEFKNYMKVEKNDETLMIWDTDNLCKRKCMLAGDACEDCHDCCMGGTNSFGETGYPKKDCPYATKVEPTDARCGAAVQGAVARKGGWFFGPETDCQCPEGTVITGTSDKCKLKESMYYMFFNVDDLNSGDGCACKYKQGCGLLKVDAEDVLPANAQKKGMPPPVMVGTRHNINTGIEALDREFYGVWWMKDNPVPEELASMAGAFSKYTGQNLQPDSSEVEWPFKVGVPNSLANKWSWPDTLTARKIIMPQYTSAIEKANNFTMRSTTEGSIDTTLTTQWGVWVEEWGLYKLDEHTWNRPTTFQSGSPWPDTNYTLTRIINEDGTATEHFANFTEYMKTDMQGAALFVWDNDDPCKRTCMLAGNDCTYCHDCCAGGCNGSALPSCSYKVGDVPSLESCPDDGHGEWSIAGASSIVLGWQSLACVIMAAVAQYASN